MSAEEIVNAIKSGESENIQQSLSNTMAEKISALLDDRREELGKTMFNREETDPVNKKSADKEYLDEAQSSWRVEVPGEGVATVKGANETQAIDRALSKLNISKNVRDVWKNGKKRKELKISKD